jgi:hypothetical protein
VPVVASLAVLVAGVLCVLVCQEQCFRFMRQYEREIEKRRERVFKKMAPKVSGQLVDLSGWWCELAPGHPADYGQRVRARAQAKGLQALSVSTLGLCRIGGGLSCVIQE